MLFHSMGAARGSPFGGLQVVPPSLVGAARALLQAQGVSPYAISDAGELDGATLVSAGFDRVEIRTRFTPTVAIDLRSPPDPENERLLREVQPSVVLTGRAGRAVIAPYGLAGEGIGAKFFKSSATQVGVGIAAALVGLVLIGGAVFR